MKSFQVYVGGVKELQELVVNWAEKNGYQINNKNIFFGEDVNSIQFNFFNNNRMSWSSYVAYKPEQCQVISIVDLLKRDKVEVKLNNEYTAIVTKETIRVGCQEFPVSVLTDLTKALESLQ